MSFSAVKEYFKQFNLENRLLEFPVSSATVELAAIALNCGPCKIAKTLSFLTKDNKVVLIVTAGDTKVNNHKFKAFFSMKAKMVPADLTEELIGHSVGGICPFAVKENVAVYLDNSLKRFATVFPACGSSNSAIELSLEELYKYANAKAWIDVCEIKAPVRS